MAKNKANENANATAAANKLFNTELAEETNAANKKTAANKANEKENQ